MIEIMINKALAGDPNAFAKVVQIAEKLEALTAAIMDYFKPD